MAQTKEKTKAKKSVAIRVINILFIIALVVAIVVPILMVTPVATSIKASLKETSWAKDWAVALNNWMKWHVVKVFNLPTTFRGHGVTFTSCLYLYAIYFGTIFSLFMWYLPFVINHRNKVKGKNQVWRKAVNWTCFGLLTCVFLAVASSFFSIRLIRDLGDMYKWVIDLGAKWCRLFAPARGSSPKGVLNVLVVERISTNYYAWALIWFYVMLVLFEFICLVVASVGKASQVTEVKENVPASIEEDKVQTPAPVMQPVPVAAAEESKLIPTVREVALLDALNPLYETKIEVLPDLEDKKEENLSDLKPVNEEALDEAKDIKKIQDTAESLSEDKDVSVLVLPGIDEWDADPWPEDEQEDAVIENDRIEKIAESLDSNCVTPILPEEPKKEEKPLEDLTAVAAPEEENVPVEELKEEEAEEPSKIVFINSSFRDGLRPQEEDNVREEIVAEDRTDKKEIVCNNEHKEILTKPVSNEDTWDIGEYHEEPKPAAEEEPVEEKTAEPVTEEIKEEPSKVVFINSSFKDGLRPQEDDNVREEIVAEDRTDKKEIVCNNEHKEILTKPVSNEDTWDIGEYHEEPKPVAEEKPAEEKPAEPQKPQPRVSQIGLMKFDPSKKKNGPAAPIGVINPIKKEEPVVEEKPVEEKKVAAPIAGPLHSIEKSKHGKIEAVKARHVSFELKNYQVKTYEGDLTAQEAFNMGVTKVQPTVNPIFANQEKGSAWKEKKRMEDIRQNGYGDVVQVEKLTGKTKPSMTAPSVSKKPMSIRDMLKAKKSQNTESSAPVEEKKISKPITPVAFKPIEKKEEPAQEVKKEVSPLDQVPSTPFHPIAPLPKKEKKRPEIKPIAPIDVKKNK